MFTMRWLMQPKIWRLVCFGSSVVGLLCYALSSFNHLFGKWTSWKIFLYSVFSFTICIAILFTKAWQRSTTLRLKAHLAFLVLMITCVYSFFFDKVLKGKPDAYSLISCASFAIMSLALSRQTHCGFEVDLLYFFSGGLTMQLMKIKLWLIVVGASFSYSLIILRSSLDTSPEIRHLELQVQDEVVIQVDSESQTNDVNSATAIQVVSCSQEINSNSEGDLIKSQLMACIKGLRKMTHKVIPMVSKHVNEYLKSNMDFNSKDEDRIPLRPDVNLVMDALPRSISIANLRQIVKLMVEAGFEEECCHVYSSWRREFLEQCLSKLGLQELSLENIESWVKVSNITLRILFPIEKRLCHCVFLGLSSATHISFKEVCEELTIRLLNFANNFTLESYSPNLLCCFVPKVFNTLTSLITEFESLFSDQYSVSLRNEALEVWKRLSVANERIFMELENFICHDTVQAIVPGGGLHPVTCQIMNCLNDICEAMDITFKQVLDHSIDPDKERKSSLIYFQVARIIELLESNLEAKSKEYTDPALGYVFMMNNIRYMGVEAKEGKMRLVLDKQWFLKNIAKVRKQGELYQRSSWTKVLDILKLESNESMMRDVIAESLKQKLNLFNLHFEEICNVQSTWSVFDKQVREQTRVSLENILLPTYGNFIGRFQDVLGKHAYDYIEYGLLDIQDQLNHLFLVSETTNLVEKQN
ncbi:hypothetical protein VNO77_32000 [Canavalia gladiata]|uniref:Exocyst subunit Exo70 family protein n=1 Tax=Canavalia gladiata TaxID=3824 RepID=A0AAN9KQT9_CANGL